MVRVVPKDGNLLILLIWSPAVLPAERQRPGRDAHRVGPSGGTGFGVDADVERQGNGSSSALSKLESRSQSLPVSHFRHPLRHIQVNQPFLAKLPFQCSFRRLNSFGSYTKQDFSPLSF
jgi:hypothetical protein